MINLNQLRETAAPWEVAWTLFPLVGVLISLWMIWDCTKDLQATRTDSRAEPVDYIAAWQAIRNELIVCFILILLLYAGVTAITSKPVTTNGEITPTAFAITIVIAVISVLLPIKSLLNRYDRHRIVVLFREGLKNQEGC